MDNTKKEIAETLYDLKDHVERLTKSMKEYLESKGISTFKFNDVLLKYLYT